MLAVLMLVLLAGSVGAAWLVARARHYDPQVAVDILADIRAKGLHSFWSDAQVENWYVVYNQAGRRAGWYVDRRRRMPDGTFAGERVRVYQGRLTEESWKLSDDARRSKCWVTFYPSVLPLAGIEKRLILSLENGKVEKTVEVRYRGGPQPKSLGPVPAPKEYVPDGLADLALYQAAVRGKKTVFVAVPHSDLSLDAINFVEVLVRPLGGRVVVQQYAAATQTTAFDKDRTPVKITYSTGEFEQLSTAEEVVKLFPAARLFLTSPGTPATSPSAPAPIEAETQPADAATDIPEAPANE